jgi:hypothetical protein
VAAEERTEVNNPYFIGAGSLEVSGTFEATFTGDPGLAALFPPGAPRFDVRFEYPEGTDRHCPVCQEPAAAVVMENMTMLPWPTTDDGWDRITRQVTGVNPAGYRCEPCGHRFGPDGKEIAGG